MAFSIFSFLGLKKMDTLYTGASNEKSVTDVTSTSITLSNNYSLSAKTSGFTDGSLFTLASKGYIRNTEPIRGITSIEVTYGAGSAYAKIVPCFYDYENDEVIPTSEELPSASTSASFIGSPIDYFEIYNDNNNSIVIESIVISYTCMTPSYTFTVFLLQIGTVIPHQKILVLIFISLVLLNLFPMEHQVEKVNGTIRK